LPGRLREHGLTQVEAEGQGFVWRGGSAGSRLLRANYLQLRAAMLATGEVTVAEFDHELAQLEDPASISLSPVMWDVQGQRPVG
jgi:hypothetical protein